MRDPRVTYRTVPRRRVMHSMARSGDIGLAAVLFAITLPLMAIVALTIKLESPGACIREAHLYRAAWPSLSHAKISNGRISSTAHAAPFGSTTNGGWTISLI